MDFSLTEDQQAFAASARAFAEGAFAPNAAQWDEESIFPKEALRQAGELGFMGMYTPETAGGLGLSRLDASLIVEELAKGDTATAAYLTIHNMATNMVGRYCSTAAIEEWCHALASGEKLASYCLTEPGAGSDAASLRTSAVRDGDDYVVNGSKVFISGAGDTDVLVVMLRTGEEGPKGISALLIPADTAGISYGKKEEKMGWNAQPTRLVTFDNVKVPVVNLLGNEGEGFKFAMMGLDGGRINIATCSLGTALVRFQPPDAHVHLHKEAPHEDAEFHETFRSCSQDRGGAAAPSAGR